MGPTHDLEHPGLQSHMQGKAIAKAKISIEDEGYQTYLAACKLNGKRAVITGADPASDAPFPYYSP
jgi:hypothetical protein